MPKQLAIHTTSLLFAWVKNVYSLGTVKGTNGAQLHTGTVREYTYPLTPVHKSPVMRRLVHQLNAYLSPSKITYFNPLYSHLYPLSTAPINNQNERKIGKE